MPQQGTPYLIPFGSAGMVAHPNRWRAKAGEILLGENVTLENDLINKEPAATYYDSPGVGGLQVRMTWSAASQQLGMALWYDATPSATWVGTIFAGGVAGAVPNPWTPSITRAVPVGAVVIVRISTLTSAATAVTDSRGNRYTLVKDFNYAPYVRGQFWVSVLTTALQVNDTLSVTAPPPTANMNLIATAWTGVVVPLNLRSSAQYSGNISQWGPSPAILWGSSSRYPLISAVLIAAVTTTATADYSPS